MNSEPMSSAGNEKPSNQKNLVNMYAEDAREVLLEKINSFKAYAVTLPNPQKTQTKALLGGSIQRNSKSYLGYLSAVIKSTVVVPGDKPNGTKYNRLDLVLGDILERSNIIRDMEIERQTLKKSTDFSMKGKSDEETEETLRKCDHFSYGYLALNRFAIISGLTSLSYADTIREYLNRPSPSKLSEEMITWLDEFEADLPTSACVEAELTLQQYAGRPELLLKPYFSIFALMDEKEPNTIRKKLFNAINTFKSLSGHENQSFQLTLFRTLEEECDKEYLLKVYLSTLPSTPSKKNLASGAHFKMLSYRWIEIIDELKDILSTHSPQSGVDLDKDEIGFITRLIRDPNTNERYLTHKKALISYLSVMPSLKFFNPRKPLHQAVEMIAEPLTSAQRGVEIRAAMIDTMLSRSDCKPLTLFLKRSPNSKEILPERKQVITELLEEYAKYILKRDDCRNMQATEIKGIIRLIINQPSDLKRDCYANMDKLLEPYISCELERKDVVRELVNNFKHTCLEWPVLFKSFYQRNYNVFIYPGDKPPIFEHSDAFETNRTEYIKVGVGIQNETVEHVSKQKKKLPQVSKASGPAVPTPINKNLDGNSNAKPSSSSDNDNTLAAMLAETLIGKLGEEKIIQMMIMAFLQNMKSNDPVKDIQSFFENLISQLKKLAIASENPEVSTFLGKINIQALGTQAAAETLDSCRPQSPSHC